MKKQLLILALMATAAIGYSQGTIAFGNSTLTKVKINDGAAVDVPPNAPVVYGVFVNGSLSPVLPLGTASVNAGIIQAASVYALPGAGGVGTIVSLQVRGWSSAFATFQAAQATPGALYGQTDVRQVTLADVAGPGQVIWQGSAGVNPNRFNPLVLSTVVPEPSTIALGLLGGALLLFRRRNVTK